MNEQKWEKKAWGITRCTVKSLFFSSHELELNKGGYCSFHYHRNRRNHFFVEAGLVRVVWAFGWELHHKDLRPGEEIVIIENIPHQFQVLESGLMREEYFSNLRVDLNDIIRLTQGGSAYNFEETDKQNLIGIVGTNRKLFTGWNDD